MRWPSFVLLSVLPTASVAVQAQTNPFDGLNSRGQAYSDPAVYAQHKERWLARVQALPENVDVLEGAADFFMILDRPLARELLARARDLEPNDPKWVQKLARLHRLNASSGDAAEARLALSLMERAYAMDATQSMVLTDLPTMAFDAGDMGKARAYAEQLLNELGTDRNNWRYGDAVHKGNLILGRIAVREGRLADAVTSLRASGETPGSGVSTRLGPTCRWPETCWSTVKRKRCWGTSSCAVCSGRWAEAVSMPGPKRFRRAPSPISARTYGTDRSMKFTNMRRLS